MKKTSKISMLNEKRLEYTGRSDWNIQVVKTVLRGVKSITIKS